MTNYDPDWGVLPSDKPYQVYINVGTHLTADWQLDRGYDSEVWALRRWELLTELKHEVMLMENGKVIR